MESEDPKDRVRRRHLQAGQRQLERQDNDREASARRKASGDQPSRKQARKQARNQANEQARNGRTDGDEFIESWQPIRRSKAPKTPPKRDRSEGILATVTTVHSAGRIHALPQGDTEPSATSVEAEASLLASQMVAVGDVVRLVRYGERFQAVGLEPRRSVLMRSDPSHPQRRKVLAANVDIAILTLSADLPALKLGWIDRLLVALAHSGINPCIAINKTDRLAPEEEPRLLRALAPYRDEGIPVFLVSAQTGAGMASLRAALRGSACVFVGHSGVGKSSLANALDPDGTRSVAAVRTFDGKGRHTTTSSGLRRIGGGTTLIDTPGVREFGLGPTAPADVIRAFPDLERAAANCRFRDCAHTTEPACAVREQVGAGTLSEERYQSYLRIVRSLDDPMDG